MKQIFCTKCGEAAEQQDAFCKACGAALISGGKAAAVVSNKDGRDEHEAVDTGSITSDEKNSRAASPKRNSGKTLKKLIILAIVIFTAVRMLTLLHTCDECHKMFFGAGYYDGRDYNSTLCAECATRYYNPFPIANWQKR